MRLFVPKSRSIATCTTPTNLECICSMRKPFSRAAILSGDCLILREWTATNGPSVRSLSRDNFCTAIDDNGIFRHEPVLTVLTAGKLRPTRDAAVSIADSKVEQPIELVNSPLLFAEFGVMNQGIEAKVQRQERCAALAREFERNDAGQDRKPVSMLVNIQVETARSRRLGR